MREFVRFLLFVVIVALVLSAIFVALDGKEAEIELNRATKEWNR